MDLIEGNRITLLKNGADFFPALINAIDGAALDVRIETYLFEADAAGKRIGDAMMRAARRGVAVRLLVDGVGSWRTPTVFFEALQEAGVKLLIFRPVSKWFGFRRSHLRRKRLLQLRLHRRGVARDHTLAGHNPGRAVRNTSRVPRLRDTRDGHIRRDKH